MKLSIIVPWRNIGDPWRWQSWKWLRQRYERLLPETELVYGSDDSEPFNRSSTRNHLVERSEGDILLIADADTVFHRDQIEVAISKILSGASWVIPYSEQRYYNVTAEETALIWASPFESTIPELTDSSQWDHKITSWAGLLLVTRESFDKVGGYDERFQGWGYEDNAFRAALDHRVGPHARVDSYALHLWHPAPEEECFGQPNIEANRELYRLYEAGALP